MSDPVLIQEPFVWFVCDRDPDASEPIIDGIGFSVDPDWLLPWWNKTTNDIFFCLDLTPSSMVWEKVILEHNLPLPVVNGGTDSSTADDARLALGLDLNSTRNYNPVSLSFNSARTPSTSRDVLVIASVQMSISVLQTCTINGEVNTGSGFVSISTVSLSSVVATVGDSLSFIVPKNTQYRLISSGTGTNSIISVYELGL